MATFLSSTLLRWNFVFYIMVMILLECFMIYKACSISYPISSSQQSHEGGIIISMSDARH